MTWTSKFSKTWPGRRKKNKMRKPEKCNSGNYSQSTRRTSKSLRIPPEGNFWCVRTRACTHTLFMNTNNDPNNSRTQMFSVDQVQLSPLTTRQNPNHYRWGCSFYLVVTTRLSTSSSARETYRPCCRPGFSRVRNETWRPCKQHRGVDWYSRQVAMLIFVVQPPGSSSKYPPPGGKVRACISDPGQREEA